MPTDPSPADVLIRAAAVHSMQGATYRAVAVRGPTIVAVSPDPSGLDHLVGPDTQVVDAGDLTVLPAFADAHEHLLEAARNAVLVPVERARTIDELRELIAAAAATVPSGGWVLTSNAWHESNLAERRPPTLAELDTAVPDQPVLVRRGGHFAVANGEALRRAGIDADTPDPPGGSIGHLPDGSLSGALEGSAVYQVLAAAPRPTAESDVLGLRTASASYAALGVGTIREALINANEVDSYLRAWEQGALSVRVRPLVRLPDHRGVDASLKLVEGLRRYQAMGDDWLRLWGLKLVFDGGVVGAALEAPYASDPGSSGHLNWDPDEATAVCSAAVRQDWRIGTHAAGDRAVRVLLDVYERVIAEVGGVTPGTLVIEHALLASAEQRARAVRLAIPITVQHPLLWNMGGEMLATWGEARTMQANPLDQWLADGAELAVGTDIVRPFNPLTNVWGMVTRGTKSAGVLGKEHAIPRQQAIELYTVGPARLDREGGRRGTIRPGSLADLVAYPSDPLTAPIDDLPTLTPTFTMVGGHATYDGEGRLGNPGRERLATADPGVRAR